ncbi:hypothetical protein LCGC14_2211960, partial [marine sediment metagenome]
RGGVGDGNLVWVPFSINETKVAEQTNLVTDPDTTEVVSGGAYFVVKATLNNGGSSDDLGLVLTYDDVGKYRTGQVIYDLPSSTGVDSSGNPVIWYYLNWHEPGNPGWYLGTVGIGRDINNFQFGLYSFGNSAPFANVTLEAYFIDGMPNFNSYWTDANGDAVTTGSVHRGDLNMRVECTPCDPNIAGNYEVLFGALEAETIFTEGEYENGVIDETSVDWWETRDFQAGDLVEWEAGDPADSQDHDFYWFDPSTAAALGLPTPVPGPLPSGYFATGQGNAQAIENGGFIASETGTYFLALDNWGGGASTWFVETKASRGSLDPQGALTYSIDTATDLDVAKTEAIWQWNYDALGNIVTGYDKTAAVSLGTFTPTNLGTNLSTIALNIDNEQAPVVNFTLATYTLLDANLTNDLQDLISFSRPETATLDIGWEGTDANGDTIFYELRAWKGATPWQPTDEFFFPVGVATSYSWRVDSLDIYEDDIWTVEVRARDNTQYGGEGTPIQLTLFLNSAPDQVTVTVTGPETTITTVTTSTTTTATPGFTLIVLAIGLVIALPLIVRRKKN